MMKIHCMMQPEVVMIVKQGDNHIHVATFLQRFLFGREMLDQHGALSGGERLVFYLPNSYYKEPIFWYR